jgi:hypothetical protein
MIASLLLRRTVLGIGLALLAAGTAAAQDANQYKGYLGVWVVPADGGMRIQRFIPNTPAELLSLDGGITRNHTIMKLGGLPTRSLSELRTARDRIPEGQEAKMLVRGPEGVYHVWISRNEGGGFANEYYPAEGAPPPGKFGSANPGSANPGSANPGSGKPSGDYFYKGDVGEGDADNFRPKGSGVAPKGAVPATAAPAGDGDFRPKK